MVSSTHNADILPVLLLNLIELYSRWGIKYRQWKLPVVFKYESNEGSRSHRYMNLRTVESTTGQRKVLHPTAASQPEIIRRPNFKLRQTYIKTSYCENNFRSNRHFTWNESLRRSITPFEAAINVVFDTNINLHTNTLRRSFKYTWVFGISNHHFSPFKCPLSLQHSRIIWTLCNKQDTVFSLCSTKFSQHILYDIGTKLKPYNAQET